MTCVLLYIAKFAIRIFTTYTDPAGLMSYTACGLIEEVLRRIIGKATLKIVKQDLQTAVGWLQLRAGQDAGREAAVHAMSGIFSKEDIEALLFMDASNDLNRQVTFLNSKAISPSLSRILIYTYRSLFWLFVNGQCLLSKEGTTQGDPLAMVTYVIGTINL